MPVPEDWDAAEPAKPSIHAAGRGELHVYDVPHDQLPWTPENHSEDLELVDGPTPVTIKLPEFSEDPDFSEPADSINLSLTGLDPIDLLSDVRFFE